MQREESVGWLLGLLDLQFRLVDGHTLGLADGSRANGSHAVAVTTEFNQVDTGLVRQDDPSTAVRAELISFASSNTAAAASVVLAASAMLEELAPRVPAQPGTFLPDLVSRAGLTGLTVKHGLLRAPTHWDQGVPQFSEANQLTLLLEVILVTQEEFEIGQEQGVDKLTRRLHRRATDVIDWMRV